MASGSRDQSSWVSTAAASWDAPSRRVSSARVTPGPGDWPSRCLNSSHSWLSIKGAELVRERKATHTPTHHPELTQSSSPPKAAHLPGQRGAQPRLCRRQDLGGRAAVKRRRRAARQVGGQQRHLAADGDARSHPRRVDGKRAAAAAAAVEPPQLAALALPQAVGLGARRVHRLAGLVRC